MRYLFSISLIVLQLLLLIGFARGVYRFVPSDDDKPQCFGTYFDLSRLQTIDVGREGAPLQSSGRSINYENWFPVSDAMPTTISTSSGQLQEGDGCSMKRMRAQEKRGGVPIYGANMVLTYEECPTNNDYNSLGIARDFSVQSMMLSSDLDIQDVRGKAFENVLVNSGYTPSYSVWQAKQAIADYYDIRVDDMEETQPELYVFPGTPTDYLAYFYEVLVEKNDTAAGVGLYRVILDAHTLEFLSICTRVSPESGVSPATTTTGERNLRSSPHQKYLQQQDNNTYREEFSGNICQSCATYQDLEYVLGTQACNINTLYLNNIGKTTTCTEVSLLGSSTDSVLTPYVDDSIHWRGTYDCFNSKGDCYLVELPSCADALSDVQYGAIQTLNYLRNSLKVLGGLRVDASNPQSVFALVHYRTDYCNAFYSSSGRILFGDCKRDCSSFTPLVSIDVVAHELMHGVTGHSSNLEYSRQSGGLNEAYSDILGTVMEFFIDDSFDKPDFLLGEELGIIIRNLENPSGRSIDSTCDYNDDIDVHYSSGILNKAWVKSVRACEMNGCLSLRHCVLMMGPLFLYTNIQMLTTFSNFDDAALLTCRIVPEFLTSVSDFTACTEAEVTKFVIDGWASVDMIIDGPDCNSVVVCSTPKPSNAPSLQPSNLPSADPALSLAPSLSPSSQPSLSSVPSASMYPSMELSLSRGPSSNPTARPSMRPTHQPTTARPSPKATNAPTHRPTFKPAPRPTTRPTLKPTPHPTNRPTPHPTPQRTDGPSPPPSSPTSSICSNFLTTMWRIAFSYFVDAETPSP